MSPVVLSDGVRSKVISFDFFHVATKRVRLLSGLHTHIQVRALPVHTVYELKSKATRDDAIELCQPLPESEGVLDEFLESAVDVPGVVADHLLVDSLECAAGAGECDYVFDGKVRSDATEDGWESVHIENGGEIGHTEFGCWLRARLQVEDEEMSLYVENLSMFGELVKSCAAFRTNLTA